MDTTESGVRVLVVDPNEEVRWSLSEVLVRLTEMQVRAAGPVSQALNLLQQWQPHVVLLETKRPDGRGLDLCREILARAPDVRLLVVTSYIDPWERLEALLAGAAGYLLKEVDAEALAEHVKAVANGGADHAVEV